jgi:radical SAM superfamily enzyme YgiQ (UPF0313 family)
MAILSRNGYHPIVMKSQKVLLISENMCRESLIPFPLGPAWIAAAVEWAGHEVMGLDLMFSDDPAGECARAVEEFHPDCIGLSIRNIDNQDAENTKFYVDDAVPLIAAMRQVSGVPIVLGGAGYSIYPTQCLDYLGLEYGVVGEGEATFPALLECLASGDDPRKVPGVATRLAGITSPGSPGVRPDLALLPVPDRRLFDVTRYDWRPAPGRPLFVPNIQSRRGCARSCIYCSSPDIEGTRVRVRPVKAVVDEMESMEQEFGLSLAIINDSLFNVPEEYALDLCREFIARGLRIRWSTGLDPSASDELLETMARAGCTNLSMGNESGCEHILIRLKKEFGVADVERAVRTAKSAGMKVNCFLLFGGPGETRETIDESVELLDRLQPETVNVSPGVRIYPNTELARIAMEEGIVSPDDNLLLPRFYIAPAVKGWLFDYTREIIAARTGWEQ